ncbi:uncharacterized protein LOC129923776 [Biomphalaria glabrata]|uniref:Uncharacterized protein LOC129923776 n=1 Tax=Biomphalaria glabrata TaxID=6526 RepID=A0A9W2ZBS8_BIOGL|nr:uncharacterized protein LOC129923776 [Biomphalaria glabrata]
MDTARQSARGTLCVPDVLESVMRTRAAQPSSNAQTVKLATQPTPRTALCGNRRLPCRSTRQETDVPLARRNRLYWPYGLTKTYAQAVAKKGRSIATQTDTLTPPPPPPPPTQKKTPPKNTPLKKQESPVVMLKNRFSVLADESMETEQHVKTNTPGEPGDIMSDTGSPQRTQPDTPTSTELEVDQLPKGRNQSGEDARGERGGNNFRSNQRDLTSPERKTSPKRGLSSSPSKPKNKNTKVTGIKGNPSVGLPRPNSSK